MSTSASSSTTRSAAPTGDDAAVEQAMADLTGAKQASAAFFEEITGGAVSAADVEAALAPPHRDHVCGD